MHPQNPSRNFFFELASLLPNLMPPSPVSSRKLLNEPLVFGKRPCRFLRPLPGSAASRFVTTFTGILIIAALLDCLPYPSAALLDDRSSAVFTLLATRQINERDRFRCFGPLSTTKAEANRHARPSSSGNAFEAGSRVWLKEFRSIKLFEREWFFLDFVVLRQERNYYSILNLKLFEQTEVFQHLGNESIHANLCRGFKVFLSKAYGDRSVKITAVRGYTEPFVFHSRTATVACGHCVQITTNHLFLWIVPRLFYRFSRPIVILVNSSFRFHVSANRIYIEGDALTPRRRPLSFSSIYSPLVFATFRLVTWVANRRFRKIMVFMRFLWELNRTHRTGNIKFIIKNISAITCNTCTTNIICIYLVNNSHRRL